MQIGADPLIVPVWIVCWLATSLLWTVTCYLLLPADSWKAKAKEGWKDGPLYWMFMLGAIAVAWVDCALRLWHRLGVANESNA